MIRMKMANQLNSVLPFIEEHALMNIFQQIPGPYQAKKPFTWVSLIIVLKLNYRKLSQ
jgi:hypothetical protein